MQIQGGFREMGMGLATFPLGFPLILHGADNIFTGMRSLYTGASHDTISVSLLQKMGASPTAARLLDTSFSCLYNPAKAFSYLKTKGPSPLQNLLKSTYKNSSSATITSPTELNRFNTAAHNLSKTGKDNIRILRNWAKSKGWKKLPNPQGNPERWGVYKNGTFSWRLRLKPEGSLRSGLDTGSNIPRFDARLEHGGNYYINPFTNEIGTKKTGTHLFLNTPHYWKES